MKMSVGGVGIEGGGSGKTLELSPYDQQRRAHKAITDSTEIVVSPRSLASELCCPICLDLLTNTMTTKECLHRFCSDCITTALLRGNKECPTCRKKLVSKRSLRADPNFDALISKIWPDRKEYEAMQERARQRFNRQSSVEALSKSIEAGIRAQAQHRRQRVQGSYEYEKRKRRPKQPENADRPASDGESASEASAPTSSAMDDEQAEIELILHPHPDLEKRADVPDYVKQPRYLKTTANATIDHLNKYLSLRIMLDGEEATSMDTNDRPPPATAARDSPDFQCTISVLTAAKDHAAGSYLLLDGDTTLIDVRTRHWAHKKPLQLDFQLGNPPPK